MTATVLPQYAPTKAEEAVDTFLSIAAFLLRPVVMAAGWNWFIVPFGAPPITWFTAMGAYLLLRVTIPTGKRPHVYSRDEFLLRIFAQTAFLLLNWGVMWLVSRLV